MAAIRVFYFPYTPDGLGPADRRRFGRWCSVRKHQIVGINDRNIQLAVLTPKGLYLAPYFAKRKIPIILDIVDAQNLLSHWGRDLARGLSNKRSGNILPIFPIKFSSIIRNNLKFVHTVVVANPEQQYLYNNFARTTYILDSHSEIPMLDVNLNRPRGALFWEGLPYTWKEVFPLFAEIQKSFEGDNFILNIVTSEKYKSLTKPRGFHSSRTQIATYEKKYGFKTNFYPWNLQNLLEAAQVSEFGLLPVGNQKEMFLKAENRLLIMWRLGLPTLFSNTPAYSRVSSLSGVTSGKCESAQDWLDCISEWRKNPTLAIRQVELGQLYIKQMHSEENFLQKWDNLVNETQ